MLWLLFILCSTLSIVCLPEEILIGGLFEVGDNDGVAAFRHAIDMVNNDNNILPNSKLRSEIVMVDPNDSFLVGQEVCKLMSKGIAGIFGPQSPNTWSHVQSQCDTKEIPHIAATKWDPQIRTSSCLINLYPHPLILSEAITDLVKAWKWEGFTVLYDDFHSLKQISELLQLADDRGYIVAVRQIEGEDGNYRKVLQEIKHSKEKNIVVECSVDILYEVLSQAQQVGLMGSEYSYVISSLDFHSIDLDPFKWGGTNITGIRLVKPETKYFKKVVSEWLENSFTNEEDGDDMYSYQKKKRSPQNYYDEDNIDYTELDPNYDNNESPGDNGEEEKKDEYEDELDLKIPMTHTALIHDGVQLFSQAINSLNLDNLVTRSIDCSTGKAWEFGYTIRNYMQMSEYEGLSGVVKFDSGAFRSDIELDIVELMENGLVKKGVWNTSIGLHFNELPPSLPQPDPTDDLRNTTFIILIALTHPYGMLKEASESLSGNEQFEGFGVDLIHELSQMSGFNYTFRIQHDKSSGNPIGNGQWTGMIGEVLAGRADLGIADMTITRERERDADFTMPFMNLGISILYRKPMKAPPSLFSFLSPFSGEVWGYMLSAYFGVSLLLFIIGRISPYEWTNPYPCIENPKELENQFSLFNSYWFTIGSLMQQGSELAPIAVSTRMVAAIWWFFTLIMVSSYTANLAAFLTVESTVVAFRNVEELANHKTMKYGAKAGGSTSNFFRDSNVSIYQKMWKYMEAHPDVMMETNDAGVSRVIREKDYAFFMESSSIEYEVERACDLDVVGGLLDNKGYGIVMRQNSSYRNVLSRNVVSLQEKGKLTQLKNKWWKEKRGGGACLKKSEGGAAELDLDNVGGVFVVLLGGCIVAIFISFAELSFDILRRDDKISFKQEFIEEIKFISRCHGTTKPVRKGKEKQSDKENDSSSESTRGMDEVTLD